MPIYSLRERETREITKVQMKWSELQIHLTENPQFEQIITKAPALGDSVRLGVTKTDDSFNDLLKNIGRRNPGSTIQTR